ncbi:sensor domain-containing diguanylate cyclase [Vibrio viridaestus]|uniref:diguanylate cyclase n=1 Tax=Vibrio viridaestus TaxID=2487322 RepID=A0A3N9THZ4_9VIBR|nr:diguanylate cyclase [Vibrio viridaestus]RQW63918.1 diguanylate cyclase [Vibrio viridaestus]
MKLSHFRLRSLVTSVSLVVVSLFIILYLSFQYFWVYQKRVTEVHELQAEENTRVSTILGIKGAEMTASLEDYAAWQEMIEFIRHPSDEFKEESMNTHALTSNKLEAFFMFTPQFKLSWGLRYDYDAEKNTSYEELLPTIKQFLKHYDDITQKEEVDASYNYIVINKVPYLLAMSRVCESDGFNCHFGYMAFLKKLRSQFLQEIEQTTGLKIDVSVISNKHEKADLPKEKNVSYIIKPCGMTGGVVFKVHHNVKLPEFLNWDDMIALGIFSLVMFSINMVFVSMIVKPVVAANKTLEMYKESGELPKSDSFISLELKQFGRTIYRLVNDLERSREQLQWQSEHDSLTQLANRYLLEKEFLTILDDSSYNSIVLCLGDIDHFKAYNDNYGHISGDNVLYQVSNCLNSIYFSSGDRRIVARFGGEEFCVVVASKQQLDATAIATSINESIADLGIEHAFSSTKNIITMSVGAVLIQSPSPQHYLKYYQAADRNLYQAKNEGRNRVIGSNFAA